MHAAVLVGLLGFLTAAIRLGMKLPSVLSQGKFGESLAIQMTTLMAVLCLVYVGLCVNSFVQARLARRAQRSTQAAFRGVINSQIVER